MSHKVGFVFPGQGSQQLGMLHDVYTHYPWVPGLFKQASDILSYDLWDLIQNDAEKLAQTEYTQVAVLVCDVVMYRAFEHEAGRDLSSSVKWMAGHSLGEYAALVCAGAIEFADAVSLVQTRGRLMQQACQPGVGGMAALIGLDDQAVADLCAKVRQDDVVAGANFNCKGQVVISGHLKAVQRAVEKAPEYGAKRALMLEVSVPAHSDLMKPALPEYEKALTSTRISSPVLPVIQNANVDVTFHPDEIRAHLLAQLYRPVPWVQTIERLLAEGVNLIVECGPGSVLSGLNRRISREPKYAQVNGYESLRKTIEIMEVA